MVVLGQKYSIMICSVAVIFLNSAATYSAFEEIGNSLNKFGVNVKMSYSSESHLRKLKMIRINRFCSTSVHGSLKDAALKSISTSPVVHTIKLRASAYMHETSGEHIGYEPSSEHIELVKVYAGDWPRPFHAEWAPHLRRASPRSASPPPPPPVSRYGREDWAVALRAMPQSRVFRRILPRLCADACVSVLVAAAYLACPSLPVIGSHPHEVDPHQHTGQTRTHPHEQTATHGHARCRRSCFRRGSALIKRGSSN
jgi:hypothetical protein